VNESSSQSRRGVLLGCGLMLAGCLTSTGCQVDVAGQTLPSAYHLTDDVQYYAPGPEFKLANEAAAMAKQKADRVSEPQKP
jgi:hypothetical protein